MTMVEWSEDKLFQLSESPEKPFAVFLYTPLCGTCKLTEQMLTIIQHTGLNLTIVKSNVNFLPRLVRDWKVTSVPCIVMIQAGGAKQFLYQMNSIDELYKILGGLGA